MKVTEQSTTEQNQDETSPLSCYDLIGTKVIVDDGTVGFITDLLVDDSSWIIHYVIVDTGRWLPGRKVILSTFWLKRASEDDPTLLVDVSLEVVKNGPEFDSDIPISRDLENEIFAYYARKPYWT